MDSKKKKLSVVVNLVSNYLNDVDQFYNFLDQIEDIIDEKQASILEELYTMAKKYKMYFIIGVDFSTLESKYDSFTKKIKTVGMVMLLRRASGQSVFEVNNKDVTNTMIEENEVSFIVGRMGSKLKFPLYS